MIVQASTQLSFPELHHTLALVVVIDIAVKPRDIRESQSSVPSSLVNKNLFQAKVLLFGAYRIYPFTKRRYITALWHIHQDDIPFIFGSA